MSAQHQGPIAWFFRRLGHRVWVRATAFTAVAVLFALAAGVIGKLLPFRLVIDLGQDSVGSILQIIATAMLTATTFSVTAMVTAYSSATTNATPRASQLLIADPTSQNALSTFIGAFVFSMVGIIALSTGYYNDQGRTILFIGTLMVVAMIVLTLLRWIAHLADFGRMADVIDRVERAATDSVEAYATRPTLGARRWAESPTTRWPVWAEHTGYVAHLDVAALNRAADSAGIHVFVECTPGRVADRTRPLAWLAAQGDEEFVHAVRGAFDLEPHRSYEQDPRLGVIALAEIGSRALSPSTNDPGTAIEVIAALQRVFERGMLIPADPEVQFPSVSIAPPRLEDLLTDGFRPIARDGAGMIEVQMRLQKSLASLAACSPDDRAVLAKEAKGALVRAKRAMPPEDYRALRSATRRAWS